MEADFADEAGRQIPVEFEHNGLLPFSLTQGVFNAFRRLVRP